MMDLLNTAYKIGRVKPAIIYIGGADKDKYETATGFNQYFRKNADPNEAEVVPLSDIINYEVEDLGNGYINIAVTVRSKFSIPSDVFSNYLSNDSGSLLTYYIDIKGFSNNFLGFRNFANQPNIKHFLLKGVQTIVSQWNGFSGSVPKVLDFESATTLYYLAFHDYRSANDRINVRNANQLLNNDDTPIAFGNSREPDNDEVFANYNLNLNPNAKKVIYVHKDLETINNNNPLDSLQQAINRNADVRFIDPVDVGLIVDTPVNPQIADFGATWVQFDFQDIPNADFYEVWVQNYNGVIEQYFPIGEITNADKYIGGLDANRDYQFQLVARDYHYNNSVGSVATPQITTLSEDKCTISEANIGGTYVEIDIVNPSPYTINEVEVYVNGVLNNTIQGNLTSFLTSNLQEQTAYDIDIIAKTDEGIDLISNQITATTGTIDTVALYQNGIIYLKLNEISGNAIDDVNNYNGTLVGGVTQGASGLIDKSYSFDGSSGYVNIPISGFTLEDYSFHCYANADDWTDTARRELITLPDDVDGTPINFGVINGKLAMWRGTAAANVTQSYDVTGLTGWHSIGFRERRTSPTNKEVNIFIDGVIVDSINGDWENIDFNNGDLTIGGYIFYWKGKIDEFFLNDGYIDLGKISDLHNNGNGTTI